MKITEYIVKMVIRYKNHHISQLASQLAYDILFSSFPFILLTMSLVGFVKIDPIEVINGLQGIMPDQLYGLVASISLQLLQTRNSNVLSFSLIFALYSASRAFRAIRYGLNRAYDEKEDKNIIKVSLLSILFMIIIAMLIIFVLIFIVFGSLISSALVKLLGLNIEIIQYLRWMRYPIGFLGMIFVFSSIYRLVPSKKIRWYEAIPGAIFTSIVWIVFSLGFAFYVNTFGKYTDLYGSIGTIIVALIWLQMISITILLGGELNAMISEEKSRYKSSHFR